MPYFQKKDVANYFVAVKECPAFAEVYEPGDVVKYDGIYGCAGEGCLYEVAREKDQRLPFDLNCGAHDRGTTPRRDSGTNSTVHWYLRALAQTNPNK